MNAAPLLTGVARALALSHLDAVMIGNAAAALQGAPVTTLDFDFMFRATPANMKKLKRFASELSAMILRPYYPASSLYRVIDDESGLQVDFMSTIHGVRSFEGLKSRAGSVDVARFSIQVADLADIIKSKKAAGRPKDRAVLPILERTLRAKISGK